MKRNKLPSYLSLIFLFLHISSASEENPVYEYGVDNFKQQIEKMDGNFIMFYAPWCRHCTEFFPIWQELAEMVNTGDSKFAIAQVDCTTNHKLCQDNDITGYPTLLYFHKNSFVSIEYKGTRDLPSLTLFLSEVFSRHSEFAKPYIDEDIEIDKESSEVKIYSGMAYLHDQNIEKFVSKGQHFVMFYAPWCKASQSLAPLWAELAVYYSNSDEVTIGKVNCMESEITCGNFDIPQHPMLLWIVNGRSVGYKAEVVGPDRLAELKSYVEEMLQKESYEPNTLKKKKVVPVARIATEENLGTVLEKDLVFINYFTPWCAHCMQLSPLWLKLGEKFQNESRVLIADVDCVHSKSVCENEKIENLPTLILYKNKKIVNIEYGGKPLESLISLVTEHLQDTPQTTQDPSNTEPKPKDEL